MEDFVICLDLFQGVDLLLAALAHLRASRLDLLHDRYVRRGWYDKIYPYEYSGDNGRITGICICRMYDGLCKEMCSKRDMRVYTNMLREEEDEEMPRCFKRSLPP